MVCSNFVLSQAINLLVQCRNITILSSLIIDLVWFGLWCLTPFSTGYIIAVNFIGGGNRRTRRKQPTCRKSLANFNT